MGYFIASQRYDDPSGAYVFHVAEEKTNPVFLDETLSEVFKNEVCAEKHVRYPNGWNLLLRNCSTMPHLEVEWNIPQLDENVEAFISFKMESFQHNGKFYTDSNGQRMAPQRKRHSSSVETSFYPVTTSIFIQEKSGAHRELSILTDRSQAGASLREGEVISGYILLTN